MGRDIAAFLSGLIIIAVIFVLVRPNSQGPAFVKALGAAISNMLTAATGGAPAASSGTGTQTAGATSPTPGTTTGAGAATAGAGTSAT